MNHVEKGGLDSFLNLLKATRVHRTLTGLSAVMVPVAFANRFDMDILFFCVSAILLYAGIGIHNAKKDNDYELPSYSHIAIIIILLASLAVSLKNMVIFATILAYLLLGFFYNNFSRFILFGDVTVLSFTHHTLPIISASILVGLDIFTTIKLSIFMFITFWFLIHIKNLKDAKDDKKRGYKTIATEFVSGKKIKS